MEKRENLSISLIIPVYNAEEVISRCLQGIFLQDYAIEKIEVILIDGGSTDTTLEIAKQYKIKIIKSDHKDQEYNRIIGVKEASNEILCFLDADNFLPHKNWLKNMIQPFIDDETIIAVQPYRYHYSPQDNILNRYFALTGVNDPVGGYYLRKRDRVSYIEDEWYLAGEVEDKGKYFIVRFEPSDIPSLGANGYMVRRDILMKIQLNPETAHHMDLNYDLITAGYNKFAMVKETIIHHTISSIPTFFWKKFLFARRHHLRAQTPRKCPVYTKKDIGKILFFILSALTIIHPLILSIKGYKKVKDIAWFLHPIICLLFLFTYGFATIDFFFRKLSSRIGGKRAFKDG